MKVAIQRGHCFRRSGSTGTPGEQAYTQAVGAETVRRLKLLGHDPVPLLADDPVPRTDAFVAIHADGSHNVKARGASVGYRDDDGMIAGASFKVAYQRFGFPGGFRPDNYTAALAGYYGTRRARQAGTPVAFVVEGGFLTNADDRAYLTSEKGVAACSQAIVEAVLPPLPVKEDEMTPEQEARLRAFIQAVANQTAGARDAEQRNQTALLTRLVTAQERTHAQLETLAEVLDAVGATNRALAEAVDALVEKGHC